MGTPSRCSTAVAPAGRGNSSRTHLGNDLDVLAAVVVEELAHLIHVHAAAGVRQIDVVNLRSIRTPFKTLTLSSRTRLLVTPQVSAVSPVDFRAAAPSFQSCGYASIRRQT